MVYRFRFLYSRAVAVLLPLRRRQPILDELARQAEHLQLAPGESAIFDVHEPELKAVIDFHARIIRVLTPEEYRRAGLPERTDRLR
jgi:hypothetical protein